MLSQRGYCRALGHEDDVRPVVLTAEDIERHSAVTVVLQRRHLRPTLRTRVSRVIEGPVGGVVFVVLLGASLVLWFGGAGW